MTPFSFFLWMMVTGFGAFFGGWSTFISPSEYVLVRVAARTFTVLSLLLFIMLMIVAKDSQA